MSERLARALAAADLPAERPALEREVRRIARREAPLATGGDIRLAVDHLLGLGPVEELLRDPDVTDVLVNGPEEVWVERAGRLERTAVRFGGDDELLAAIERVLAPLGLRIDRAAPMTSARLPDGSRLHAVIPPACPDHPVLAVRRFTQAVASLDALVDGGACTAAQARHLRELVRGGSTVLVSGGTGAGKTTLLNLLAAEIPAGERVVIVEDASELAFPGHVVRLEGRPPNAEGAGGIGLRELVRTALRLRPDRLVVGEVRGSEALDLILALNTGHRGALATVHANGPEEAMWRLETLALSGPERMPEEAVSRQLRAAVDAVVQLERRDGRRRVVEIREGPW